jgi:hypothetical protein
MATTGSVANRPAWALRGPFFLRGEFTRSSLIPESHLRRRQEGNTA